MGLTKSQIAALQFVATAEDAGDVALWEFLGAGHSLQTLMSMNKREYLSWHSNTNMATCVLPSEYEHIRNTTSYVSITDAGRAALKSGAPDA